MDEHEATGQPGQPEQPEQPGKPEQPGQPGQRPPGWYARADRGGATWYWDGAAWAEENSRDKLAEYEAKVEARRRKNTKLSTLAALAIVSPIVGLLLVLFGGGEPAWTMIGIWLLGAGLTLWIIWLAFGAVVDEVQRLREGPPAPEA